MFTRNLILPLAVAACTLMSTALRAEEQVIEIQPVDSGRLYAYTTFQDCCDLDSYEANETNIMVENCSTQGGYCMAVKKIALWMFPMPELEPGSQLVDFMRSEVQPAVRPGHLATRKSLGHGRRHLRIQLCS